MTLNKTQLSFIASIKDKIRKAQYEALKVVNVHLIDLYWEIGKDIYGKQSESWGKSIVQVLSRELQKEFPGVTGYSVTNLWYMAQFYSEYNGVKILQPLVGEISWAKHLVIMGKCKDNEERRFYILATKKFLPDNKAISEKIDRFFENSDIKYRMSPPAAPDATKAGDEPDAQ